MIPSARSTPLILAPGPVTVSDAVRQAAARPMVFHRSTEFHDLYSRCLAKVDRTFGHREHRTLILPGSGSSAIEAVLLSLHPAEEPLLVVANGVFGDRILGMAHRAGLEAHALAVGWGESIDPSQVRTMLERCHATSVWLVALETSTGKVNPVTDVGVICREMGVTFFLDAVSAHIAESMDLNTAGVDVCVAVPNKALEGLPGVALVSVRKDLLARGNPGVPHSMDVREAAKAADDLETVFTPPATILFAMETALDQLAVETLPGRRERYAARSIRLRAGFTEIGFSRLHESGVTEARAITTLIMDPAAAVELQRVLKDEGYQVFTRSYGSRFSGNALVQFSMMGEVADRDVDAVLGLSRTVRQK